MKGRDVNVRHTCVVLTIAVAVLGGAACKSPNTAEEQKKVAEEQKKVDDLQGQLDAAKQQLADKEKEIAAKAAETQAQAVAEENAKLAAPAREARRPRPPAAKVGSQAARNQGAVTTDQSAVATELVNRQREINAQQSDTNAQVQREIEALKPVEYTIPAGTVIPVRTTTELSTSQLATGSRFTAVLERDLRVGDTVLATQGAEITGVVVSSDPGGRVKGVASLDVTIHSVAGRKGHTIPLKADSYSVVAKKDTGRDLKRTGILSGAGAVVGAIAGGGKGAAIGAGAGAAAGVGTNMATRGKAAVIPAETLVEFRLSAPSTVVYQQ
jgi:hypothetical protein